MGKLQLVVVRHGESLWNKENLFTGWHDIGLSDLGEHEAARAGNTLATERFEFDVVFCSVLKRAIKTACIMLEQMDLMWLPIHYRPRSRTFRLNRNKASSAHSSPALTKRKTR